MKITKTVSNFLRLTAKETQHGFTLVELLIVIAIIGILTAIVIINVSSAGPTARDGRRKTDIKSIQSAVEQFYSETHKFPRDIATDLVAGDYLPATPLDPQTNAAYAFEENPAGCTTNCTAYCTYAQLEKNPGVGEGNYKTTSGTTYYYYLVCSSNSFLTTFITANSWGSVT